MWSTDLYANALYFAAQKHHGQRVPGTDLPYLVHITTVAGEVLGALSRETFAVPDLAVACALLHDTIEDTSTTAEEIEVLYGAAVAAGVQALSKDPAVAAPHRMSDSLRRIRAQPPEVWIVKLADRITNLAAPPVSWPPEKRRHYRDEAAEILAALGSASAYLAARLGERIVRYRAYLDP